MACGGTFPDGRRIARDFRGVLGGSTASILSVIGAEQMYTAGTMNSVNKVPIDSPVNSTIPMARRRRAGAGGDDQRHDAQHHRGGGHQVGPQAHRGGFHDSRELRFARGCSSLANWTMRIPCLLISPSNVTSPTCV